MHGRGMLGAGAALLVLAGVAAVASRRDDVRHALGAGPFDRALGPGVQAEIARSAGRPAIRPTVRYPARLLPLLAEAESNGRDLTADLDAFRLAWDERAHGPCTLVLVTPDWRHTDPISGHRMARGLPGGASRLDPATGDRLTPVAITPATRRLLATIAALRRSSAGTGRGTDPLTGYAFEPAP